MTATVYFLSIFGSIFMISGLRVYIKQENLITDNNDQYKRNAALTFFYGFLMVFVATIISDIY